MKRYLYITLLLLAVSLNLSGQDSQFSQYYSFPLYLGPSFAGASGQTRINASYRNQWSNLPTAYSIYAISFDHFVGKYNSGIGLMLLNDREGGTYNSTTVALSYSYMIEMNPRFNLQPGLQVGYYSRSIDYGSLLFSDAMIRNSNTTIEDLAYENIHHFDIAFSLISYSENMWLGATTNHLMALSNQFKDDPTYPALKISAFGGIRIQLPERVRNMEDKFLSFSFFYKQQGNIQQMDVGASFEQEPFRIGLWVRSVPPISNTAQLNAIVLLAGTTINNILINYSYDISTARLLSATGGSHEISVAYTFEMGYKDRRRRAAIPCPKF